jgi:hypothetical protein
MARAIIKNDRLIKLTVDDNLGIEVGVLPVGIHLARLRWDGKKIINLMDLESIYVNRTTLMLHAVKQPNCELVNMKYSDRKKLFRDPTTQKIRIKTQDEIDKPKKEEYRNRRKTDYPSISDQVGAIIEYLKTKTDLPEELKILIKQVDDVKIKWKKLEVSNAEEI